MATELLSIAATADVSDDIVITDTPVTVALKTTSPLPIPQFAQVFIRLKDDSGDYTAIGQLNAIRPADVLAGPGTYQLMRPTQLEAVGAFSA